MVGRAGSCEQGLSSRSGRANRVEFSNKTRRMSRHSAGLVARSAVAIFGICLILACGVVGSIVSLRGATKRDWLAMLVAGSLGLGSLPTTIRLVEWHRASHELVFWGGESKRKSLIRGPNLLVAPLKGGCSAHRWDLVLTIRTAVACLCLATCAVLALGMLLSIRENMGIIGWNVATAFYAGICVVLVAEAILA